MGTTPYLKFEITICDFKSLGKYYKGNLGICQQKNNNNIIRPMKTRMVICAILVARREWIKNPIG